jgi:hypothetical protein
MKSNASVCLLTVLWILVLALGSYVAALIYTAITWLLILY